MPELKANRQLNQQSLQLGHCLTEYHGILLLADLPKLIMPAVFEPGLARPFFSLAFFNLDFCHISNQEGFKSLNTLFA